MKSVGKIKILQSLIFTKLLHRVLHSDYFLVLKIMRSHVQILKLK